MPDVVSLGETDVVGTGDQLDPGKFGGDHLRAAVLGATVNNNHLQAQLAAAGRQPSANSPATDSRTFQLTMTIDRSMDKAGF
jgi:hypothetical protein